VDCSLCGGECSTTTGCGTRCWEQFATYDPCGDGTCSYAACSGCDGGCYSSGGYTTCGFTSLVGQSCEAYSSGYCMGVPICGSIIKCP
jgi:hypothetical protein